MFNVFFLASLLNISENDKTHAKLISVDGYVSLILPNLLSIPTLEISGILSINVPPEL
ncbi:hypothetical protein ACSXBI_14370 [Clostridium perfringens]|uniref:hypothetical protein n=1 Tax=Clostridium perfringens TaxID=1502 RepID=UPI0028CF9B1F|nr:hypothetical protein [Clostridium perfringens]MDT7981640.1 hypothetical protein [Clostridium perfringens]